MLCLACEMGSTFDAEDITRRAATDLAVCSAGDSILIDNMMVIDNCFMFQRLLCSND